MNKYGKDKLKTGYWEFNFPNGKNYARGYFYKGNKIGFWKFYDRKELYSLKNRKVPIEKLCKLNIQICQKCVFDKELPKEIQPAFFDEDNNNHCLKWLSSKTYNDCECCVPIECPYYLEQIALKDEEI